MVGSWGSSHRGHSQKRTVETLGLVLSSTSLLKQCWILCSGKWCHPQWANPPISTSAVKPVAYRRHMQPVIPSSVMLKVLSQVLPPKQLLMLSWIFLCQQNRPLFFNLPSFRFSGHDQLFFEIDSCLVVDEALVLVWRVSQVRTVCSAVLLFWHADLLMLWQHSLTELLPGVVSKPWRSHDRQPCLSWNQLPAWRFLLLWQNTGQSIIL